jgi:DNA-binding LacI/PurR family transcriptional regulator
VEVAAPNDIENAFERLMKERVGAVAALQGVGLRRRRMTSLSIATNKSAPIAPTITVIGVVYNQDNPGAGQPMVSELQAIARATGLQVLPASANNDRDLNTAFADLARNRADAIVIARTPTWTHGAANSLRWLPLTGCLRFTNGASLPMLGA